MKKEKVILPLKFIRDCLKSKFNILSKDDEKYHRKLECSLIRCLSEMRKKEISDIQLPNDFDKKLINRLQNEKQNNSLLKAKMDT